MINAVVGGDFRAEFGYLHTQRRMAKVSVFNQAGYNLFDDINGYGKADAYRAAAGRVNRRVDADHTPMCVQQRAAGVAGVDGRVGLDGLPDSPYPRRFRYADPMR